jgi:hypothetical protein
MQMHEEGIGLFSNSGVWLDVQCLLVERYRLEGQPRRPSIYLDYHYPGHMRSSHLPIWMGKEEWNGRSNFAEQLQMLRGDMCYTNVSIWMGEEEWCEWSNFTEQLQMLRGTANQIWIWDCARTDRK